MLLGIRLFTAKGVIVKRSWIILKMNQKIVNVGQRLIGARTIQIGARCLRRSFSLWDALTLIFLNALGVVKR